MSDTRQALLLITAFSLLLTTVELSGLHGLQPLENRLSDFMVRYQAQGLQPDGEIVIVDIDDSSLARMQDMAGNWPWPRAVHGELVRGIDKQRPKAIVFGILFSEQDQYRSQSDRLFNQALDVDSEIYFPMVRGDPALDAGGAPLVQIAPMLGVQPGAHADPEARIALLPPLAIDPRHWRSGTINFAEDSDGVGRRYPLYTPAYGWRIPSLPARVATDLGYQVPDQRDMILAWRGHAGTFKHIAYADLYEDFSRERPLRPQDELTGKIVIIGTAVTGMQDRHVTPMDNLYPGVEILATALDNLKNQRMMRAAPGWFAPFFALALLAWLCAAFWRGANVLKVGGALLAATLLALSMSKAAVARLYLLPLLTPLLLAWGYYFACALQVYLRARKSRGQAVRDNATGRTGTKTQSK